VNKPHQILVKRPHPPASQPHTGQEASCPTLTLLRPAPATQAV
jgi:hypothetical protein